ncbi:MAG: 5'-3' exonuclease H3TH domain-containing protein, partial [Planctomycetota bacterium]
MSAVSMLTVGQGVHRVEAPLNSVLPLYSSYCQALVCATSMPESTQDLFSADKKLFLLDGMALVYRAHFALIRSPRFTSGGQCTSAVFGLFNAIMDIFAKENPTHIACAFDTSEPTQRHIEYPEYKAQRDEMPEDLSSQVPLVDRLLEALKIPVLRLPGYEADDIIGTIAGRASERGFETWMVTPDKDYHQLVTEDIFVYKPGRKGSEPERLGVSEVCEQWQVDRVEQVIDVLGLMGDTSDNVPGVPGVGPKTAMKLVSEFGSVEAVIENSGKLKGKQRERIEENAEQALLSKRLVTIQLDVPIELDWDSLERESYDDKKLRELLTELEFETIGKKLFGKSFSVASARSAVVREKREREIQQSLFDEPSERKSLADVEHSYKVLKTRNERKSLIERLSKSEEFCFDTEATGLNPRTARPLGLSFCLKPNEAYFVVCPEPADECQEMLREFEDVFADSKITKIGHNLKYDVTLLRWNGITVNAPLLDTMLVHTLTEPEIRHGLDSLCELYLNYKPISTESLIGPKGKEQKSMADVPL